MIVEFLGPAGAGKTTIAHALSQRLQSRGHPAKVVLSYRPGGYSSSWDPGGIIPACLRVLRACLSVAALARHPRQYAANIRLAKSLVRILPPSNWIWLLRFGQYIPRLAAAWHQALYANEIVIFDQAFVQAVSSLALFNGAADNSAISNALNIIPQSDLVIQVGAPRSLLERRLQNRMRRESCAERLFEADLNTNLRSTSIVKRINELLRRQGRSIICVDSSCPRRFERILDQIEAKVLAMHGPAGSSLDRQEILRGDTNDESVSLSGESYRTSHSASDYGVVYSRTYQSGYYAALWSQIERPLLEEILKPVAGGNRNCLDFACGTGRITNVVARLFGDVVGVDVASSMLAAATRSAHIRFIQADITKTALGEQFDVVTAFRFFLNAEESLRRELNGEGVRVMTVYPSGTDTPMMATNQAGPEIGFSLEPAEAVAEAIIAGIEHDAINVVRGGPERQALIDLNSKDPMAIDAHFLAIKDVFERDVRSHCAL